MWHQVITHGKGFLSTRFTFCFLRLRCYVLEKDSSGFFVKINVLHVLVSYAGAAFGLDYIQKYINWMVVGW